MSASVPPAKAKKEREKMWLIVKPFKFCQLAFMRNARCPQLSSTATLEPKFNVNRSPGSSAGVHK